MGSLPRSSTIDAPKILRMVFEGKSGSEIASACLVSDMSVTNVRRAFIREAERGGLMKAAQAYGIDEQVKDLINLQKKVNDIDGGLSAVEKGIEYGKSFEKIKVKPKEVSSWIDDVYESAIKYGLEGDEVGPLLHRLSMVVSESDLGYEATLAAMEDANKKRVEDEVKSRELETEIERLKLEKRKAEEDEKVVVDRRGLTQQKLDDYSAALSSLKGKVNIDDAVELSNLVKRLVLEKKPYKEIIAFYERNLDLDKEREEKTARNSTLDKLRQDLEERVKETRVTLDANKETLAVLDSWGEAGLSPERGVVLMRKVEEYAARSGQSKEDALDRFYSDLEEHWEPSLGFTNEYNILSARVATGKQELESYREVIRVTRQAYDSTMNAVRAKEALNERGVGDDEIVAWDGVLRECGLDLGSFRRELAKLGGIRDLVESKSAEIRKAEKKLSDLTFRIFIEEETYNKFRAANEAFREHFNNVVNPALLNVKKKMDELEAKMLDEETGIEPQMESVVTEATGQFQTTVNNRVNDFSNEIDTLIGKVKQSETEIENGVNSTIAKVDKAVTTWEGDREKIVKEFFELGEGVQRFKILADVLSVIRGEEPDLFTFTFSFISLLDAVKGYYSKTKPNLRDEVSSFKNQLRKGLEYGQFSIG